MNLTQRLFLFLLLALSASCGPEQMNDCVTGSGADTFEIRMPGSFHGIEAGQEFDVYLTQDSSLPEQVIIRAGAKLLPGIQTELRDGILVLRDRNRCNWVRKMRQNPRCTVNVHKLDAIHLQGAASISSLDSIRGSNLLIDQKSVYDARLHLHYGNVSGGSSNCGKTILKGFAGIFAYDVTDVGQLLAEELRTEDIYLYYFSPLDSRINARMWLEVTIYGNGNVIYRSSPKRGSKITEHGTGRVLQQP